MLKLGLRSKFFLYSNTLIVVTMTLVTILAVVHERRARFESIENRGRGITEALAIHISDALANEDLGAPRIPGSIADHLSKTRAVNLDLMRYVLVADARGIVTHSDNGEGLGRRLDRALGPESAGTAPVVDVRTGEDGEPVLEVRAPLGRSDRFLGSLTVGFSLEPAEREVAIIAKRAVLVALALMLANSALTAVYVESLIRPILGLNQTLRRAARGDLSVRAHPGSAEVGELAEGFNHLMDELEEARDREKLRQVQLAHTEKMAAVGTLAAGVAHEVNNPLSGVLTCIENMRGDLEDREMQERYLDLIHDGLKRIERTVANLLDFSRQRKMVLEPTSINHNLQHVVELVEYQLRKGLVQVAFDLDPREPYVLADHFQMEQLFLNLVLNALQAMPDGGTLTLSTRGADGSVVAEVRDTGVGIPSEIRDRIFDPFFTTRDVDEGTGLGLTVSDSIVAAHGGTLEVESAPGTGSAFRVSFPMLKPPAGGESAR